MSRTQIFGSQIEDNSITDADIAPDAAILLSKIALPAGTFTSDYSILDTDYVILASASSGLLTLTLPSAIGLNGKQFVIKKVDSTPNAVVLSPVFSQTIDNSSDLTVVDPMVSVTIVSDNSNWWIL